MNYRFGKGESARYALNKLVEMAAACGHGKRKEYVFSTLRLTVILHKNFKIARIVLTNSRKVA